MAAPPTIDDRERAKKCLETHSPAVRREFLHCMAPAGPDRENRAQLLGFSLCIPFACSSSQQTQLLCYPVKFVLFAGAQARIQCEGVRRQEKSIRERTSSVGLDFFHSGRGCPGVCPRLHVFFAFLHVLYTSLYFNRNFSSSANRTITECNPFDKALIYRITLRSYKLLVLIS